MVKMVCICDFESSRSCFFQMLVTILVVTAIVSGEDCEDLNTPRIPPLGVVSQAGYGAPCDDRSPCEPGMSCCRNARRKMVCEGVLISKAHHIDCYESYLFFINFELY